VVVQYRDIPLLFTVAEKLKSSRLSGAKLRPICISLACTLPDAAVLAPYNVLFVVLGTAVLEAIGIEPLPEAPL
jgi:hypothetical protein